MDQANNSYAHDERFRMKATIKQVSVYKGHLGLLVFLSGKLLTCSGKVEACSYACSIVTLSLVAGTWKTIHQQALPGFADAITGWPYITWHPSL